ncbi:unnamed protein product, partial [marine sediment metagenome]
FFTANGSVLSSPYINEKSLKDNAVFLMEI